MPLFGEEPPSPQVVYSLAQPRILWPKSGEPAWRGALKRSLTTLYFGCATTARRTSMALRPLLRWRKPVLFGISATIILVLFAIASVVAYRMWWVPAWVLDGAATSEHVASRIAAYRSAQGGVLSVLIQAAGGFALFAGLFFTWRQIIAGQEAQVSERFTRSVEQLANDRVDVRVGGIHGLERIAFSRASEFQSILMLLTAFVLERARVQDGSANRGALPLDLQVALAVLVRFQERLGYRTRVSLRGINLSYVRLSDVNFGSFDLREADFRSAVLDGASFAFAYVQGTNFANADLRYTNFSSAMLGDTKASGANLTDAVLRRATGSMDLRGADLTGADLEWALLIGDFRGAILKHTLCSEANFYSSNFEGVDLRETKGLWDGQISGSGRMAGVILPGKSRGDAYKEASGRPASWQPPRGQRISIRGGSTSTTFSG